MPNKEAVDIAVIGAGPAGLIAAREAARKGAEVIVLEEHEEIGVPSHCAGLLNVEGLKRIGITPEKSFIQSEIRGAHFHSPSGSEFTVESRQVKAFVVDRIILDKVLGSHTTNAGADIRLGSKVSGLIFRNKHVSGVKVNGTSLNSKIVIDGEGGVSKFVREVGLKSPKKILPAMQFEVEWQNTTPEFVDIFVGRKIAPDFFAWIVPTGSGSARVGLACHYSNPRRLLEIFIKRELKKCKVKAIKGGAIPISGPIPRTYAERFLVVGDAAGQTKPTTGGGVITGGICAGIAGEVAANAVARSDFSAGCLKAYQDGWKKELGKEFLTMLFARRTLNLLSDRTMDKIFRAIIENELQRLIEEKGDIDFQSEVLRALVCNPAVIKVLFAVIGDLL